MSTVSGKKSWPSRTERDAVAVARTTVSPMRATTAPSASCASFPASNDRVRSVPLIGPETEMASAMSLLLFGGAGCRFPVVDHLTARRGAREVIGDWQPASFGACLLMQPPGHGAGRKIGGGPRGERRGAR